MVLVLLIRAPAFREGSWLASHDAGTDMDVRLGCMHVRRGPHGRTPPIHGRVPRGRAESYRFDDSAPPRSRSRYASGDSPYWRLNAREKYSWSSRPTRKAISPTCM